MLFSLTFDRASDTRGHPAEQSDVPEASRVRAEAPQREDPTRRGFLRYGIAQSRRGIAFGHRATWAGASNSAVLSALLRVVLR
jgi:hypothetical protein